MYNPQDYNLSLDDIPTWMRPQYRGLDWALLMVMVLCGVVLLPLATRSGLPPSPEAELETYRILEMREGLFTGALYPRWAANLNYGYGSPLFNHLAPLPHYSGGAYSALVGDDPQIALKIQLIGATVVMIVSFFAVVRRRWGDLAALFGSMVVLLSPYTLLTIPYLKTDLGLLWGLAFFCSTLWTIDRVLAFGRGREIVLLAGSVALLLLADTGFSPVLFVIILVWALSQRIAQRKSHGMALAIGFLIGMGLSAFYYLPAIVEINDIQWRTVNSFPEASRIDTLFQSPPPLDRSAYNYAAHLYLGLGAWLSAGVGIVAWGAMIVHPRFQRKDPASQATVMFFILLGLLGLSMILVYGKTVTIWAHGLDPVTPMDWGGLVLLSLAVIASQAIAVLEVLFSSVLRLAMALFILVGILLVSAATSSYVPTFNLNPTPTTITQHLNDEARGDAFGTFRDGYLLPSSVNDIPVPPSELPRDLQSLPPNTRVTQRSLTNIEYEIFSAEPQPFTMLDFSYPGWEVQVNGERVEPTLTNGLMTIELDRGLNRVEILFATTQARRMGWWISLGALLVLVVWTAYTEGIRQPVKQLTTYSLAWLVQKRQRQRLAAFIVLLVMTTITTARLWPSLVTRETPSDAVPREINTLDLLVIGVRQSGVSLLGYELNSTRFSRDDSAILTLYWLANGQRVDPYQIRFTFLRDGARVQSIMYKHLTVWPARRWSDEQYMVGVFEIPLPDEPATYQLMIELGLPTCDYAQLLPCTEMQLADIYDLRGPTGRQIVLPQPMIVYN